VNNLLTWDFRTERKAYGSWGIYIFFILWPFGVLLYAIKNYRAPWAKNIAWLYTIFFGFTFVIPNAGVDASRYADELIFMAQSDFSLENIFSSYLNKQSGMLDIAQKILTFIVSRFTDDYRFLFAAFGMFMGYFLSRIVWFLAEKTVGRLKYLEVMVIIAFALVIGIWDIGGVRWNVAAVIFIYGVLRYIISNEISGLWICSSAVLVHWSFIFALLMFFAYKIIGDRIHIYFALFIVSFFLSELNLDIIRSLFSSYAPGALQESRGTYLSQEYVDYRSEHYTTISWYISGHWQAIRYYILLFSIYFYARGRHYLSNYQPLLNLFSFTLFFYGVFNILSDIPSVGRFLSIGNMLFLAVMFWTLRSTGRRFPVFLRLVGIPVLILFIIVRMRIGFDFIGIWSVLGNPLFAYFAENNLSLIDIIKDAITVMY
jgi:hypothetical protein